MSSRSTLLHQAAHSEFDVVVVGGGIAGACAAWDASLRGLRVLLLERGDFGGSTSAQSLKILHGGIRYLQHMDIPRLRESCHERGALLRIAPHLTRPVPFVVPTYGFGMKGKFVFRVAFGLLALLTADRNRDIPDPAQRIRNGSFMSRQAVIDEFPGVETKGLTGAAVFFDGQIINPPRAVFAIVDSATRSGATALNYCSALSIDSREGKVCGLTAVDELTGETFSVSTRCVINASGPYAGTVFRGLADSTSAPPRLSRDMAVVVRRRPDSDKALAAQTKYKDPDAILSRGNRHLFVVPWRDYLLVGVNSKMHDGDPNALMVSEDEIGGFIDEINEAMPALAIKRSEIDVVNAGLLPFGDNDENATNLSFGKRSLVIDESRHGGPEGLVTAVSVRWTMGRATGMQAVDLVERQVRGSATPCRTHSERVTGGDFDSRDELLQSISNEPAFAGLDRSIIESLASAYGSRWQDIRDLVRDDPSLGEVIPHTDSLKAQIVHSVRAEQAVRLSDVVLRRTGIGTGERPTDETINYCARTMAAECNWTPEQVASEIRLLQECYPFSNHHRPAERLKGVA